MTMLINDTAPQIAYIATAGQTVFAVPFEFFAVTDLVVERNGVALTYNASPANNSQFSVIGANVEGGGSITLGAGGAALGEGVVIYRNIPLNRRANYPVTGPFAVRALNTEQARQVAMMQQLEVDCARSFKVPRGESLNPVPAEALRAGKFLAFDAEGNPVAVVGTVPDFLQADTGAVARTVQEKLRDTVSVKDFGTVGNGTANDTAGITAADGILTKKKYVPAGIYDTTLFSTDLNGPYFGEGQIRDSANNLRAPEFSAVKFPPASFGNWDSPDTAFNGDLSKMQRVSEHRISGATTLGQPTTGYTLRREGMAEILYGFVSSEAGHNQQTAGNDGRTGAAFWQKQVFHAGNGDAYCNWVSGIATGTKSGSTHFLANPAIAAYSGQLYGGASGVYLQGVGDLNFDDLGNDVAAQGVTFNFIRTNKTGAKQADWTGIRMQSVGSEEMDAWCSFVGLADRGIDMSKSNFGTGQAAFTLAANQRYYGNSTNVDSVSLPRNTTLGDAWFDYSSGITAWNFVVFGSSIFQIASDRVNFVRPPVLPVVAVSALPTASFCTGMEYYVNNANATTRLSTVAGGGSNFVKVFSNGTNWLIA